MKRGKRQRKKKRKRILTLIIKKRLELGMIPSQSFAQSALAVEYIDCFSAER